MVSLLSAKYLKNSGSELIDGNEAAHLQ